MATTENVAEKSPEQQAYELAEFRRLKCLTYEANALDYGDHEDSIRHKVAQILCAGQYVRQSEGGDITAERALMRYAAAVTKAIAIALDSRRTTEEVHDVVLYDHEAAIGLAGLSALLEASPRLISAIDSAGLDLRSEGKTGLPDDGGDESEDEDETEVQP